MDRRSLLKLAAAGTAAAALPEWLVRAFLQGRVPEHDDAQARRLLDASFARARSIGKPLLVFVIPRDPNEQWVRGLLLGGVVNHASDDTLADLSLAEVVCAPAETVRVRFADTNLSGEPLAMLLEPSGGGVRTIVANPKLPDVLDDLTPKGPGGKEVGESPLEGMERRAQERVALATAAVRGLLAPDRATLERRAEKARATLAVREVEELERASAGSVVLPLDRVDRGAGILRLFGEDRPERRERCVRALRDAAARRLLEAPPSGSRWARSSGCGLSFDGEADAMNRCGMAFVPEVSRRLLVFLTER